VAVVIPPDYAQSRTGSEKGRILTLVDGSDTQSTTHALVSINGIAARMNLESQQELVDLGGTVTPHVVLMFNPQGRTSSFMLPALLAISFGIGYSGNGMRRLVQERAMGNLERLLMTPISYTGLILGKLVPWFFVGILNAIAFLLVMRFGFQVPIRGSLPLLLGSVSIYVATVLALGSWIAAGSKNMGQANGQWAVFTFPSLILSGYVYPIAALPIWLRPISYAMPQTHFIEVMRGICLRGANASELAPHLVYLLVAPVALSVLAAVRFRRHVLD
jgi:ABC-2 type transport system permease protein